MLKAQKSVKREERQGVARLSDVLSNVSSLTLSPARTGKAASDMGVDAVVAAEIGGRRFELLVECKSEAQPRHVRPALLQLRHAASQVGKAAVPVLVAPFLSDRAQALCREFEVGYVDFEGNALLSFGTVFIERSVATRPAAHQRELKSLYKPKAGQVLRELLNDPARVWLTTELAEAAGVSIGHVSNVRTVLLEREWAKVTPRGLLLTAPGALLDDWRSLHSAPRDPLDYYTLLHGEELDRATRAAFRAARDRGGRLLFSSFSAANWLAPYARGVTGSRFVADLSGLNALVDALKLQEVDRGGNITVVLPGDDGPFRHAIDPAPDVSCTGLIQTYLDIASAGDRGGEAADHLRKYKLGW
jgi:hypothetical protein